MDFCSIDATRTYGRLGHMVNDINMKEENCRMRLLTKLGAPRLCLFAQTAIEIGDELSYDYGDTEKNLWWRKKVCMLQVICFNVQGSPKKRLVFPLKSSRAICLKPSLFNCI